MGITLEQLQNSISKVMNKLIDDYDINSIIVPISQEEYTNLVNNNNVDYTKFYLVYSDEDINNAKKAMLYHNNTLYDITNSSEVHTNTEIQQKVSLNVTSTEPIQIYTNDINNKLVIDNYKFVEGENDVTSILKEFNNEKESNFIYNNDEITFNNTSMHIKNKYLLTNNLNNDTNLYESDIINKSDFIEISEVV